MWRTHSRSGTGGRDGTSDADDSSRECVSVHWCTLVGSENMGEAEMRKITSVKWVSGEMHGLTREVGGEKQFNFVQENGGIDSWQPIEVDDSNDAIAKEQEQVMKKMMGE